MPRTKKLSSPQEQVAERAGSLRSLENVYKRARGEDVIG